MSLSNYHSCFKWLLLIGNRDVKHVGEDTSINNEINDVWIVKINGVGNVEWERSYGGSGEERGYAAVTTPDNGFLILATTNSYQNDGDVTGIMAMDPKLGEMKRISGC